MNNQMPILTIENATVDSDVYHQTAIWNIDLKVLQDQIHFRIFSTIMAVIILTAALRMLFSKRPESRQDPSSLELRRLSGRSGRPDAIAHSAVFWRAAVRSE